AHRVQTKQSAELSDRARFTSAKNARRDIRITKTDNRHSAPRKRSKQVELRARNLLQVVNENDREPAGEFARLTTVEQLGRKTGELSGIELVVARERENVTVLLNEIGNRKPLRMPVLTPQRPQLVEGD